MRTPVRTSLAAIAAAALVAVAGCGASDTSTPTTPPPAATTAAPSGVTAQQVLDAFTAAGLAVPNPRDNTAQNCPNLGCTELLTADAVSVYVWPDEASAQRQVDAGLGIVSLYRRGTVVLSFGPGQAPESEHERYLWELSELQAG